MLKNGKDFMELKYLQVLLKNNYNSSFFNKNKEIKSQVIKYTSFINTNNMKQRVWHIVNNVWHVPNCKICLTSEVKWDNRNNCYRTYCSSTCAGLDKERLDKIKKTTLSRYNGIGTQVKKNMNNIIQTIFNNKEEIVKRRKETNTKKYGKEHFSQTEEWSNKTKKKNNKNYGTDWPAQSSIVKNKVKEYFNKMYGGHPMKNDEIYQKQFNSYRTNGKHPRQLHINDENFLLLNSSQHLEKLNLTYNLVEIAKLVGVYPKTVSDYFKKQNIKIIKHQTSSFEREVEDFLKDLNIDYTAHDRTILGNQELDFLINDSNVAIECNGIYWHSDLFKDSKYHLSKTNRAKDKNVQVIHIFENEWNKKSMIVKSRLKSILGKVEEKIYARKCKIVKLLKSQSDDFFNKNHIQSSCVSKVSYGLLYEGNLVAAMSFGKSRFTKKYEWELLRYCSIVDHSVIGGASKLLNQFCKENKPTSIVSYSDRRYSSGNLYKILGFEYVSTSMPNYYYFKSQILESRHKYQKHKLKKILKFYDESKTEYQNMTNNGFLRIWDSGNDVWVIKY